MSESAANAHVSAVSPEADVKLTSAPASRSILVIAVWPSSTARISAVLPVPADKSTGYLRNSQRTDIWFCRAFGSWPRESRDCTSPASPADTALMRGSGSVLLLGGGKTYIGRSARTHAAWTIALRHPLPAGDGAGASFGISGAGQ